MEGLLKFLGADSTGMAAGGVVRVVALPFSLMVPRGGRTEPSAKVRAGWETL